MLEFGNLAKTKVRIGIGGGRWIEVPMLSVADMQEFEALTVGIGRLNADKSTTDEDRINAVIDGRARLAELACRVCPVELHDNLKRMDFVELAKLVSVLCTGNDESDGKEDPEKKMTFPSQLQV